MSEPTQPEAYEALRVLMWELDLMAEARNNPMVNTALTTLCEYLTK